MTGNPDAYFSDFVLDLVHHIVQFQININLNDPAATGGPLNFVESTQYGVTIATNLGNASGSPSCYWEYGLNGNLYMPYIPSTGPGYDTTETAIVRGPRTIMSVSPFFAVITGSTPTTIYTSVDQSPDATAAMKVTFSLKHLGAAGALIGYEMFDVSVVPQGATAIHNVTGRVNGTGQPDTTVATSVSGNQLQITLTVNSGAVSTNVRYNSMEFAN